MQNHRSKGKQQKSSLIKGRRPDLKRKLLNVLQPNQPQINEIVSQGADFIANSPPTFIDKADGRYTYILSANLLQRNIINY